MESARACEPFLDDERFSLVLQPERLDWHGNLNWLLQRPLGEYFCYRQHDDTTEPEFFQVLVDHAVARPDAAIVYADCQWHGGRDDLESAPSLEGDVLSRMRQHIEQKQPVAVRGLMRRGAVEQAGPIRGDEFRGLSEVFVWLAKLLRWGPFVRVPQPLYHRLDHSENYHKQWFDWPDDRKRGSWTTLYTGLMEATMPVCRTPEERFFFQPADPRPGRGRPPGPELPLRGRHPAGRRRADAGVPAPPRRRGQPIAPGPACRAHPRLSTRGRPPARRQPTPETTPGPSATGAAASRQEAHRSGASDCSTAEPQPTTIMDEPSSAVTSRVEKVVSVEVLPDIVAPEPVSSSAGWPGRRAPSCETTTTSRPATASGSRCTSAASPRGVCVRRRTPTVVELGLGLTDLVGHWDPRWVEIDELVAKLGAVAAGLAGVHQQDRRPRGGAAPSAYAARARAGRLVPRPVTGVRPPRA